MGRNCESMTSKTFSQFSLEPASHRIWCSDTWVPQWTLKSLGRTCHTIMSVTSSLILGYIIFWKSIGKMHQFATHKWVSSWTCTWYLLADSVPGHKVIVSTCFLFLFATPPRGPIFPKRWFLQSIQTPCDALDIPIKLTTSQPVLARKEVISTWRRVFVHALVFGPPPFAVCSELSANMNEEKTKHDQSCGYFHTSFLLSHSVP